MQAKETAVKTRQMVLQAMKDRAPALHRQLGQAGTLDQFVATRADEIDQAIVDRVMSDRARRNLDDLPPMELVREMNASRQAATETVLGQMLEFPSE